VVCVRLSCAARLGMFAVALVGFFATAPASAKQGTEEDPPAREARSWDAAIGFITTYAPEYAGSSRWSLGAQPGGWVRWGRLSIASRSSFVVRSGDAGGGSGLRLDLSPSDKLRVGLSLRRDSGREESDSEDLRGLGDVRGTIRLRLSASYPLIDGVRTGAAISIDALGRGGGEIGELTMSRSFPLPFAAGLGASVGGVLAFGSRRHMQAYYGVTPEQAARSGYPVYEPHAGVRDISLNAGLRYPFADDWVVFGGISAGRLLGSAAASPLTRERNTWGLSAGLAYRF
jgi:MipA family protein